MKLCLSRFSKASSVFRLQRRRRGSALVETALCLLFVLVPFGMAGLQFAIVINAQHHVNQITREGARFAATRAKESTFDGNENQGSAAGSSPSLLFYMKRVTATTSIRWDDIKNNITVNPPSTKMDDRDSGTPITVTVVYPMSKKMIFPFPNGHKSGFAILGADYRSQAQFMIE